MPISLRSDQPVGDANDLTPAQVDANWTSLYGTPTVIQIASDTLTVFGAGTYRIQPETGITDSVTTIAGAQRIGDEVTLMANTVGHTITVVHGGNIHLTGADFVADTIYSVLKLKCVLLSPMTFVELSRSYNT